MSTPFTHSPVLSPSQVHLCMVQLPNVGSGNSERYQLIAILNVVSGSLAHISMPEYLTSCDKLSWTSSGLSFAGPLVLDKRLLYQVYGFVF